MTLLDTFEGCEILYNDSKALLKILSDPAAGLKTLDLDAALGSQTGATAFPYSPTLEDLTDWMNLNWDETAAC